MDKITHSDLTDFEFELRKVRDAIVAIDFAYSESEINFPLALSVPTDRLMALCDTLHEINEKAKEAETPHRGSREQERR